MLAVLQLDSPSVAILERMLQQRRLPILAELRARGQVTALEASTTLFEAALYPTLYSGVDIGDHGLYSAFPWSATEQRVRSMHAFPKPETVWERLARAGRRSFVVDPYQGWPAEDGEGLWISGWQFRNRMVLPRWSAPRDALRTLARALGAPPPAETVFGRPWPGGLLEMRRSFLDAPRRAADLVTRLLGREHFDLLWVTFSGVHLAGHYLWDLSLLDDGPLDGAERVALESALEDVYASADTAMGRIIAALPADTDLIVLSPDGMGPNTSRSDLLPGMLAAVLDGHGGRSTRGAGSAAWRFRRAMPARWRAAIAGSISDDLARDLAAWLHMQGVDWSRTRAFAVPGDCHGYVRLNLRGREAEGIVNPVEAGGLVEEIRAGLMTFHDPDGAPSIAAVEHVPDAIAAGACGRGLPDLVVRWSERPATRLEGVSSPVFGDVARHGVGPGLPGNHTDGAWAILLPRAARVRPRAGPAGLVDVAATACALLGGDASGLAGRTLLERA